MENTRNVTIKSPVFDVITLTKLTKKFLIQSQVVWFGIKWKSESTIDAIIVGSFIYKHLLRSEKVYDLDIITNDVSFFSNQFMSFVPDSYCNTKGTFSGEMLKDYSAIFFQNNLNLHMDIMNSIEYISRMNMNGLNVTNSLVYDIENESIKHVFEVKNIADQLDLQAKDAEAERKWVIEQIKSKRYCRWWGMRKKDEEYFSDWTVLKELECNNHGMFSKKY